MVTDTGTTGSEADPAATRKRLLPMRASDRLSADRYLRACLVGETGSGKTWRATKAPKPLVLLTESNGEDSVCKANPDALYVVVRTMAEVRPWIRAAASGELRRDYGCESLVTDGLTEIQRLFKDEMTGADKDPSIMGNTEMSTNDWGVLADKMRLFQRTLRSLPMHVVCTALSRVEMFSDRDIRVVPQFQGKAIQGELGQYFNIVAYCYRDDRDGLDEAERYLAMVTGPTRYLCKGCHPVTGIRRDGPADWFRAILSAAAPAAVVVDDAVVDTKPPELKPAKPVEKPKAEPAPKPAGGTPKRT